VTTNTLAAPWVISRDMAPDRGTRAPDAALSEPNDARLIAAATAGDRGAFEQLVQRHYRAAFAVALARTDNRADAEDLVHDAFVRAAERLEHCREPEKFVAWLCAIVRNLAHNLRTRGLAPHTTVIQPDTIASTASPERDAQLADLRARLHAALAELPPIQREVVLLHDIDGRTHDEIAAIVGTSSGMCRQHLFKARKRLRALLIHTDGATPLDD
jgi:RNA polymerase sigma-70 factor, ECF subfamily